jgi:hypothetical protein
MITSKDAERCRTKWDELLPQQAQEWRTDWSSLTLEQGERRLKTLLWLGDFVMCSGEKIPLSWQKFLFAETRAGEMYVAQLKGGADNPEASEILETLSAEAAGSPLKGHGQTS